MLFEVNKCLNKKKKKMFYFNIKQWLGNYLVTRNYYWMNRILFD
jgi:hypothetical protein